MDFFSPKAQYLYDDLVLLPQAGATTGGSGHPPNSFAVLFEGYSILFDAPYSWTLGGIRELADKGHPPKALVLSHRNVAGQGDAYGALKEAYALPILLHPDDASHPEAKQAGVDFSDPITNEVLEEAGLRAYSLSRTHCGLRDALLARARRRSLSRRLRGGTRPASKPGAAALGAFTRADRSDD